jgi:hypothetical protein
MTAKLLISIDKPQFFAYQVTDSGGELPGNLQSNNKLGSDPNCFLLIGGTEFHF